MHGLIGGGVTVAGAVQQVVRLLPALMQQLRLSPADMVLHLAIALDLTRLFAQGLQLPIHGGQHILQPGQVGFRRAQAQLRLMPPRMQAGDAGRFLQQLTTVARPGIDQGTDPPLTDHGRAVGAR